MIGCMSDIKISVVVPVYNVEKYLDRCLGSLVVQSFRDIEIILVDDKSTDNSSSLCDQWTLKDNRVKVVHKEINEGLGCARNTGIEIAKGDYVTFPDSDDYIDGNSLEVLYNYAIKEDVDAVYYEFNTDEYPSFHAVSYPNGVYKGRQELEKVMLDMIGAEPEYQSDVKFQVSAAKVLYKLDTIRKFKLRFVSERKIISEDLIWNLDFLQVASSVQTINNRFYHYCLNQDSLSHVYRSDRYSKLCEMADYLERYRGFFNNKKEFDIRLERTRLFYLRTHVLNMAKANKWQSIREASNTPSIKKIFKNYPIRKMPLRYRALFFILNHKLYLLLHLFLKGKAINDIRRHELGGNFVKKRLKNMGKKRL